MAFATEITDIHGKNYRTTRFFRAFRVLRGYVFILSCTMNNFLIKFFATGFGVGYIPKAPGTFATLLSAVMWWLLPKNIFLVV
ncbi:MAG: phosphatidylglycerophosphatase A, partial [Elusimicrobiota bacterium]